MMKSAFLIGIAFLTFTFFCSRVSADWIDPGIAYKCDNETGFFSLHATMHTSSPESNTETESGYQDLPDGGTLKCVIGENQVEAKIFIYVPRATGMCGAVGGAEISLLKINGRKILENTQFNYYCLNEDSYYKFEAKLTGQALSIKSCHATWTWEDSYTETFCEYEGS